MAPASRMRQNETRLDSLTLVSWSLLLTGCSFQPEFSRCFKANPPFPCHVARETSLVNKRFSWHNVAHLFWPWQICISSFASTKMCFSRNGYSYSVSVILGSQKPFPLPIVYKLITWHFTFWVLQHVFFTERMLTQVQPTYLGVDPMPRADPNALENRKRREVKVVELWEWKKVYLQVKHLLECDVTCD